MDNVNHPTHYERSTSIECIEAMELQFGSEAVYNFCLCNAYKYIWRYKNKNGLEDLEKAEWYLNKAKQLKAYNNSCYGPLDDVLEGLDKLLGKKKKQCQE